MKTLKDVKIKDKVTVVKYKNKTFFYIFFIHMFFLQIGNMAVQ